MEKALKEDYRDENIMSNLKRGGRLTVTASYSLGKSNRHFVGVRHSVVIELDLEKSLLALSVSANIWGQNNIYEEEKQTLGTLAKEDKLFEALSRVTYSTISALFTECVKIPGKQKFRALAGKLEEHLK